MSKSIAAALDRALAQANAKVIGTATHAETGKPVTVIAQANGTLAMLEPSVATPTPAPQLPEPPAVVRIARPYMSAGIDELATLVANGDAEAIYEVRHRFEARTKANKPISPKMRQIIASLGLAGGRDMGVSKKAKAPAPEVVHYAAPNKVSMREVTAACKGKDLAAILAAIAAL